MRRTHLALALLVGTVFLIGYLEPSPSLEVPDHLLGEFDREDLDGRVHLSYWEKWGSFEADACQAMVDAFNRSQDEIFVHYLRTSEVDRKAMLAIIGKDPPDVVGLWDYNLEPFAEGEALLPLDDMMSASGLSPEYYTPNYLRLCQHQGRTYALPTTPSAVALFYNKEHFRQKEKELRAAGLDPTRAPRTIEELDRYAEVLTEFDEDGKPRIMGFLHTEPGWFNFSWGYYFGGRLYDAASGKITADESANVDAFSWAKRYSEKYGREKLLRFRSGFGTFDSPQNAFIEGKVSMVMHGVWFPNFIRRHRPHMEFGVAPFPCAKGVPAPRSILESDLIAIPRGCRHPEEAWKFIRYTQTEGLAILCRLQGKHMPIRKPPANFRQGHPNLELDVFENVAASPHSTTSPRIAVWYEYRSELQRAFEHIWNWPVPEKELADLRGKARQDRIDELCRAEVEKTLVEVRERMQAKLDSNRERDARRSGGDSP